MDVLYTGSNTSSSLGLEELLSEAGTTGFLGLNSDMLPSGMSLLAGGVSPSSDCSYESSMVSPITGDELFRDVLGEGFSLQTPVPPTSSVPLTSQQQTKTSNAQPSSPNHCEEVTQSTATKMLEKNRKNAIAAKQNREKKKQYVNDLEKEVAVLRTESTMLKEKCCSLQMDKNRLEEEVDYLKSVLENQSALAALLARIPTVEGVELSRSLTTGKRSLSDDVDGGHSAKRVRPNSGGVCLHVSKNHRVSLEFCAKCSLKSVNN